MSRFQQSAARNSFRPQMEVLDGRALPSGQVVQQAFVTAADLGLQTQHQLVQRPLNQQGVIVTQPEIRVDSLVRRGEQPDNTVITVSSHGWGVFIDVGGHTQHDAWRLSPGAGTSARTDSPPDSHGWLPVWSLTRAG